VTIVCFVWWATGLVAAKMFVRPTGLPPARAALLQPNISQEMRWNATNVVTIFRRMMSMTDDAVAHGAQVVVWPESTVPLTYATTEFDRDAIESVSAARGVDVILGSVSAAVPRRNRPSHAALL